MKINGILPHFVKQIKISNKSRELVIRLKNLSNDIGLNNLNFILKIDNQNFFLPSPKELLNKKEIFEFIYIVNESNKKLWNYIKNKHIEIGFSSSKGETNFEYKIEVN